MKPQSGNYRSVLFGGILFFLVFFTPARVFAVETYHLQDGKEWQRIGRDKSGEYIRAVSGIKKLISQGKPDEAAKALNELKDEFPDFAGKDLNLLIEAEYLFAKKKLLKASRKYDEFLDSFPDSRFYESAIERQFTIADIFLKGYKRTVLGFIKLNTYEEADKIMHSIADRSGDAPIAKRALTTLARSYQKRTKYIEAYDVWAEISSRWPTGELGKLSLLEMAHSLHSAYRGPRYDSTPLRSAKIYYQDFRDRYPNEVDKYDVNEKIKLVEEQLAYKQLEIARYYSRADLPKAANLYYQHTSDSWPETTAAKNAEEIIELKKSGKKIEPEKKAASRKLFDITCLFLDNWFGLTALGPSN